MSINLPNVRLEGGVFTVEDGRPVFIDDHGTRHYDKGLSMQQLFQAGMQFQQTKDSKTISEKSRKIVQLSAELEKKRHAADTNFALGVKLQHAHDQKVMKEEHQIAYEQGRQDQYRQDEVKVQEAYHQGLNTQGELAHEVIVQLTQENQKLKHRVSTMSVQLHKSKRVADLNLSPRSSRRELPVFERKTTGQNKKDSEDLPEDHYGGSRNDGEDSEKSPLTASSSGIQSAVVEDASSDAVDPTKLSQKERIEWICCKLKEDSSYPVPEWFHRDVTDCLVDLCINYHEGLPNLLDFLEAFYQLPEEVKLKPYFTISMRKKEGMVLGAIRKTLVERNKYASFRLLLIGLRTSGSLQKYKSLKTALARHLDKMYPSIESCLKEGQVQLAENRVKVLIKHFKKGGNFEEVILGLETLSESLDAAYLARDLLVELLRKDPALYPKLQVVIGNIKYKYQADLNKDITDFYQRLLGTKVTRSLLVQDFGMDLAEACQGGPISTEYLSPELIEFWTLNRENEACSRAFWVCLANCPIDDEELLRACVRSTAEYVMAKVFQIGIPPRQQVSSLLNICQGWSKRAVELHLMGIGNPVSLLWSKVKDDASPEERKTFVDSLQSGVVLYPKDPIQFINFLWTLMKDIEENREQWDLSPQFLFNLFHQISVVAQDQPETMKKKLSDYALFFWGLCSFTRPDFQNLVLGENANKFIDKFLVCLVGTEHVDKIPMVREMYFKKKMWVKFESLLVRASKGVKFTLPETFLKEVMEAILKELKSRPVQNDFSFEQEKLFYVQMMGFIRVLIVRKYLESVETVNPEHLRQIENAANHFVSGFEDALNSDEEVMQNMRDFFNLIVRPKETLHSLLETAASKSKMELPETFWRDVEEEIEHDVDTMAHTLKYQMDQTLLIVRARNLLARRLIEQLQPTTEDVLSEIETVTTGFATRLEDVFENDERLKKLKLEFWESLCRAALTSSDASAWEHLSYNTLDLFLQEFIKNDSFEVSEWKKMAILCAQSNDEYTESVTVQSIVHHLNACQLSQVETAGILTEIANAYYEDWKIDQFIHFLNDEKGRFNREQAGPLIKKLDGIKLTERETVSAVVELRKHFSN